MEKLQQLKIALEVATARGEPITTMNEAAQHLGVTYGHLRMVLLGERESPRITAWTNQFIQDHMTVLISIIQSGQLAEAA